MNIYLKSLLVVIAAVSAVTLAIFLIGQADARRRARARGNDADRAGIVNELRNMYNSPGEGAVLVLDRGEKLSLSFRELSMHDLRRNFYSRHKADFPRFYAAGFDFLIIEAKREGGDYADFTYDLAGYR